MWESFAILEEPKNWQGWEKEMALVMTKEWIRQQCRKYRQFQTPALNDKLYLQNQGFSEIQNLEEYTVSFHSLNVTYSMRAFRSLNVTLSRGQRASLVNWGLPLPVICNRVECSSHRQANITLNEIALSHNFFTEDRISIYPCLYRAQTWKSNSIIEKICHFLCFF